MASLKRLLCCVPQYLATNNICGSNSLFTSFMVCYSKLASDSGIFCFFRNTWDDGIHNILILHLTLKKDCVDRVLWEFCHGYMFCNRNGTKCKPSSFEPSFHSRLEHLKHRCLLLISKETGVCEEFGVSRSFCRGTTSEDSCRNSGINQSLEEVTPEWSLMLERYNQRALHSLNSLNFQGTCDRELKCSKLPTWNCEGLGGGYET